MNPFEDLKLEPDANKAVAWSLGWIAGINAAAKFIPVGESARQNPYLETGEE